MGLGPEALKIKIQHRWGLNIWDKVFKNGPSKIRGRQLLKTLKGYSLLRLDHIPSNF